MLTAPRERLCERPGCGVDFHPGDSWIVELRGRPAMDRPMGGGTSQSNAETLNDTEQRVC
jgi:hypothetical protein